MKSYRTPLSTIPPSILVTPLTPDLVLLHKGDNQATVIELTCSTNTKSNLAAARSRKLAEQWVFSDMANQSWTVEYVTLEIGSLGHYQREMCPLLSTAVDLPKRPTQDLLDRWAKAATSCSYRIFLARNFPSWSPPSLSPCLTLYVHVHLECCTHVAESLYPLYISFQLLGMVFSPFCYIVLCY